MTLHMENGHILYYLIDATQLVDLVQTFFTHPDHLVIQSWIHNTFLFPNVKGLYVYQYVNFFLGGWARHL